MLPYPEAKPTCSRSYPVHRHASLGAPTVLGTSLEMPQRAQIGSLFWCGTRALNMVPGLVITALECHQQMNKEHEPGKVWLYKRRQEDL